MPEPTLTAEEQENLTSLWQRWLMASAPSPLAPGEITYSVTVSAREVADLLTAALSAVPRLALASPMVGEVVAVARDYDLWMGDYLYGGGLFNPEMADHVVVRDSLMRFRDRFRAALTGEEGRDGD